MGSSTLRKISRFLRHFREIPHFEVLLHLKTTSLDLIHKLSVQFISFAQSGPTLCDPMDCSMPGLPVHHQLPEFTQTHFH